ncbi:MAG: PQQ-binding-like beta-propeller repeat protein [Salinirussus sp.]
MRELRRRALLQSGAATATAALAGCAGILGSENPDGRWTVVSADSGRTSNAGTVPASAPTVRWQSPLASATGRAIYAVDGQAVAVTRAGLHALRIADGTQEWTHRFNVTGGATAVALAADTVALRRWFPGSDRPPRRVGVALGDGAMRYARPDEYAAAPLWVPTTAGLLGLTARGRLRRFDAAAGDWGAVMLDAGGEIWGTVADSERLYVPVDRDGSWTVEAVTLENGESAWSRRLPWAAPVRMVATGDRVVFTDVPDVNGQPGAIGLEPMTGEEVWRFAWDDESLVPWRAVATSEMLVLLARPAQGQGTYRLAGIDLEDGTVNWRTDTSLQLPYAVDGERVVGTRVTDQLPAPGLVAHDIADGSEVWRSDPATGVGPGIAVGSGLLVILATADGPAIGRLA